MSAFVHRLLPCFFFRVQSSLLHCHLGLLCCHHHHHLRYCCLCRIHHVCCLLPESPRLFHRHECLFLGGSGMKDVSAWQMSRRWDVLNELSSGKNEGSRPLKKGTENIENRFTSSVRQRCAQRRRLPQKILPSTFSLVKQLL